MNTKRNNKSNNRQGNTRNRNTSQGVTSKTEDKSVMNNKPINDPKWYIPGEDVALIGNISYNIMNGVTNPIFSLGSYSFGSLTVNNQKFAFAMNGLRVPSVTVMKYVPMYKADGPNSGINYAARRLYALMRKANSGARNYEPADLAIYLGSLESIYLRYTEIARLLLVAQKYSLKNRDIPKTIVEASGIQFVDLISNYNNYVAKLNILAQQINSLAVPALDIFKRRHVLASNIFLDDPDRPTQLIMPITDCYYSYNPTAYDSGGALIGSPGMMNYIATTGNSTTVAQLDQSLSVYLNQLEQELGNLLSDDDTNLISGDIMKAFGESNLFSVQRVSPDSVLEFVYDELMLSQFMNSTSLDLPYGSFWYNNGTQITPWEANLMPMVFATPSGDVMTPVTYQKDGNLVTKFVWNMSPATTVSSKKAPGVIGLYGLSSYIIDAYHNNPDADYTIEATRLMTGVDKQGAIFGTEIVLGWISYISDKSGLIINEQGPDIRGSFHQIYTWCTNVVGIEAINVRGLARYSYFGKWTTNQMVNEWYPTMNFVNMNYSPRLYMVGLGDSSSAKQLGFFYYDIGGRFGVSTALFAKDRLNSLHDVAVYSLYTAH